MSDERKQSKIIVSVKLTKEELARIGRCARNRQQTRHAYMREQLLAEQDRPIDPVSAGPTLSVLAIIAGKLDEYARAAPESERPRIEDCYQLLLQLRDEAMRAAGRRS